MWKRLEKLLSLKRQLTEVFSHIRGCCREDKVDRLGSDGFTGQCKRLELLENKFSTNIVSEMFGNACLGIL